jgi:hypothetical protein
LNGRLSRIALRVVALAAVAITLALPQAAGAATFGKTTVGSLTTNSGFSADVKRCTKYTLGEPGYVTSMTLYTGGDPDFTGSQGVKGVIYATSGGVPTTLKGTTNQLLVSVGQAPAWRTLTLPSPVYLAAGTYCLGTITGATAGVATFYYDSVAGSWFKNDDLYSDGPTNPFGTTYETGDIQMSMYASYTPLSAQRCDKTQNAGESFPSFVARLGANEHGCLIAGTYDLGGRFASFKSGQVLKAKANADGRRQAVTLVGELLLDVAGVQLEDLRVVGTTTHTAIDLKASNLALRYLDVDSSPVKHDTQGHHRRRDGDRPDQRGHRELEDPQPGQRHLVRPRDLLRQPDQWPLPGQLDLRQRRLRAAHVHQLRRTGLREQHRRRQRARHRLRQRHVWHDGAERRRRLQHQHGTRAWDPYIRARGHW